MKLALCIYHYFPFGGLQRDFLRIARTCLRRGHQVEVYTTAWEGELEPGLSITLIPASGLQNHSRMKNFARQVKKQIQNQGFDLIIGFNKMPGLDVYYAADVCYQSRIKKQRSFIYRLSPRYQQYICQERAVFAAQHKTKILALSAVQRDEYRRCYQTPSERFYLLPPGITRDRVAPVNVNKAREEARQSLQLAADEKLLLMVGSGFKTKALDRVMHGMASLPLEVKNKTRLWIIGQDDATPFLHLAKQLGIAERTEFLGGLHDVPRYFLAADLLVHPAHHENTGTVLLEAMVAGLPVLTVDVCGYAHYVQDANAGVVLPSPFEQAEFNQSLLDMLISPQRSQWRKNGLDFAKSADIYSLPEKAVTILESMKA